MSFPTPITTLRLWIISSRQRYLLPAIQREFDWPLTKSNGFSIPHRATRSAPSFLEREEFAKSGL